MTNITINSEIPDKELFTYISSLEISDKAKEVLRYILYRSKINTWVLNYSDIASKTNTYKRRIERVMSELKDFNILTTEKVNSREYNYTFSLKKLPTKKHEIIKKTADKLPTKINDDCRQNRRTTADKIDALLPTNQTCYCRQNVYKTADKTIGYILILNKLLNLSFILEKKVSTKFLDLAKKQTEILPTKNLDQIDPFNSLDIQERLIEFGRLFGFPFLNVTNTEKLVRINSKETLNYWLDNISYLTKALVSLKKENTDGTKYVGVSFINSVKTQKPLPKKYSPEIEECITFNLKSKEEDADLLKWKSILIKFNLPVNLTQKSDSFLRLCENILTYTKNIEILKKNEVYYKRIENLLTEYSITDIENLFNEIYFENKYKMPGNYLKKFSGEVKPCIENLDLLSSLVKN